MAFNNKSLVVKCIVLALLIFLYLHIIKTNNQTLQACNLTKSQFFPLLNEYVQDRELREEAETDTENVDLYKVKKITRCWDRPMKPQIHQKGSYWVLYNYVMARQKFKCYESITYTTHADYSFIDNLVPLVKKWQGPISLALYAPGTDFQKTLDSIAYLRDCTTGLIKNYVTFHLFFDAEHMPHEVPSHDNVFAEPYNCSRTPPFANVSTDEMYKYQKKLFYPVNVGRNVAREMAQTHYVLASDIELYPSLNIIPQFLTMIANDDDPLLHNPRKVFLLHVFEVSGDQEVPGNKTRLQEMLSNNSAVPFHQKVCAACHRVPYSKEWQDAEETKELRIFKVGKRIGKYKNWEPFYIGTHEEPFYDERLTWEGKSNKMTNGYALCVLDYDFLILNNVFLAHRPGIKVYKPDKVRDLAAVKTNKYIKETILPELQILYGVREGCVV